MARFAIPKETLDIGGAYSLEMFVQHNGVLWVGMSATRHNLYASSPAIAYFDGVSWFPIKDFPFKDITSINESPNGNILIATELGLYEYKQSP